MPNRIIKESTCTSETLHGITAEEERLFWRLVVQCDDFGRYDGRPSVILGRCFPLSLEDGSITVTQVAAWMAGLQRSGLLWAYDVGGKRYLQVTNWDKHQTKRATVSKWPDPQADESGCMQVQADESECLRIRERERERERIRESGTGTIAPPATPAPRKRRVATPKAPAAPAVETFRDVMHRYPVKAQYATIAETVGDTEAAIALWRDVVTAWRDHGYNPKNLAGMLECFRSGELPGRNGRNGRPRDGPLTEPRGWAGIRAARTAEASGDG